MSEIEEDFDDEYIEEDLDDNFEDDIEIDKKNDEDDEDEIIEKDDIENEDILKKQFEIENEDINEKNNLIYIVPPNQRITSEKLSDYEIAELINIRATNISKGGRIFTDISGLTDPIEMAKKELIDRKCPLYIKRQLGYVDDILYIEKWSPNEMIFIV